jgi:hypothetical protein
VNFFDEQTVNQFAVGPKRSNPGTCMTQVNQSDGSQVCQESDLRWPRLEHNSNLDGGFPEHRLSCTQNTARSIIV